MEIQLGGSNQSQSQDTISLDSNECINLQCVEMPLEPKLPVQECFKVIYGLGNSADRLRLLAEETKEARRLREQQEKEDAERSAYRTKVFKEHKISTARARHFSCKARSERNQMGQTIKQNQELNTEFVRAVETFDQKCLEVMQKCIEEEKHEEAVQQNAGKQLHFFQAPKLLTRDRFRARGGSVKASRSQKSVSGRQNLKAAPNATQNENKIALARWNF